MAGKMWFGTRGFETWVPAPAINPTYSRKGYSTGEVDTLNGLGYIDNSKSAHNRYSLSWNPTNSRSAIRLITDFADGVYDSQPGINPIYWIDPMAADSNVLAQGWASPHLATEDGVPLIFGEGRESRPLATPTPSNIYRYPARGARYTQRPGALTLEHYIPIPPGHSAWVGIHGDAASQNVFSVQRVNGYELVGAVVYPLVTGVDSDIRVNTEFSSSTSSGIVLQVTPATTVNRFSIYGLIVQILPTGQTPKRGGFISGQGHSGCQFVGNPSVTPYSARLGEDGRVGASAVLKETGMAL